MVTGEDDVYYRLDGDRVVEMVRSGMGKTYRYVFTYDVNGNPYSVTYYSSAEATAGATYYYILNLQGDVVQIINNENSVLANYRYDAWGNVLAVTDKNGNAITSEDHVGNLNPIRYRGYFYDTETGLYYLQSRYYDPQMRRFINADGILNTTNFLGYNMFAYCYNNPVMHIDFDGYVVTEWDKAHLDVYEIDLLETYTRQWDATTLQSVKDFKHSQAEGLRSKYRMPYETTDASGLTYIDNNKLLEFEKNALLKHPDNNMDMSFLALAGSIALVDSPLLGPADIAAAGIVIVGGIISLIDYKGGKSNPHDAEKGMSKRQKGMFQREIEDYKRERGIPPNGNLPWAVLVELAEMIKEMYK